MTVSTRRTFLAQVAAASTAAVLPRSRALAAAAEAGPRCRIVWNNDGDDLRFVAFGIPRLWTARDPDDIPLPERFASMDQFLALRMTPLMAHAVDTISYCGVFNWPAWQMPRDRIAALGDDPIQPVVELARKHGKTFLFNLRMNDCHSSLGFHGAAWWEPFRIQHPELLQSSISRDEWRQRYLPWIRGETTVHPLREVLERRGGGNRDPQSWSAYDYAKKEVRSYFLGLIEEVCRRYDVDGVDLDFLRHPFFFRFGEERRGVALMNDFVQAAARIVADAGRRKGRSLICAARVPDTPARSLEIGLDVASWVANRWINLLVVGNGLTPFTLPLDPWRKLAGPHGVPVLACITRNAPGLADPSVFLGAAQHSWAAGADGIYHFNHFIPDEYSTISVSADQGALASVTKSYQVDTSFTRSQNGTVESGPLPLDFSGLKEPSRTDFNVLIPEPLGGVKQVRLETKWRARGSREAVHWSVNGTPLPSSAGDSATSSFVVTSAKSGVNRVSLGIDPLASATDRLLTSVRLVVERGGA